MKNLNFLKGKNPLTREKLKNVSGGKLPGGGCSNADTYTYRNKCGTLIREDSYNVDRPYDSNCYGSESGSVVLHAHNVVVDDGAVC
ncbi:hypothetical protein OZ664_11955 [Elizabethkingia sp. HX WHF]|uniref:hypothetical protein n=1 Tax=Elizabethkingia TaxID=308865 RepID=UPI00099960E1|nr:MULTISPECIES: hypothetical protein [Elizabethkingia]ATL43566.1 hypothetical protein CQS02_09800 [Elizabethkingia miricola]MCL1638336.1 hypothetical protein [Elizabethkingia bruuniana]MDX8564715.1 hypothetical protein [Elizabethkingia sp. HX WHF]OPC26409.1 hypothetical protein BAY00_03700 [Elizabethkingia bruuniana]